MLLFEHLGFGVGQRASVLGWVRLNSELRNGEKDRPIFYQPCRLFFTQPSTQIVLTLAWINVRTGASLAFVERWRYEDIFVVILCKVPTHARSMLSLDPFFGLLA